MRLRFLNSFLFASFTSLIAAQPSGLDLNAIDAKGRKQGTWSKPWPSGKTRYMGQFKDDRPVGTFKHYDENGLLTTLQVHVGDGQVSRAKHFHANGTLLATGKYVGQAKDSTWNYYGPDAKLRKVERFQNGQLHGEQESFYTDGAVAERENREKGVLNGASKSWFDNGNLKSEATYGNGEPEGKMTFYFLNGKKEIEGHMVNGDRDATWYYFNTDGSIQVQVLYEKGVFVKERKENGTFKEYYDDEQLKSEVIYKKGQREGPFADYYDNGRWEVRPLKMEDAEVSPVDVERVLTGQTKKRDGKYVNDLLEGEVKEYDEQGKLVRKAIYLAGVEQ